MDWFSFSPVANLWVITIVMAVLAAALWVGPLFKSLTAGQRRKLFLIRLALIALALLALLRPGIVSKVRQKQTAVLAIMLDQSRSMKLPHLATGPTRWKAMTNMIESNQGRLAKLRENNIEVRFFTFGNRLKPAETSDDLPLLPEEPNDGESDYGSGVAGVVDMVRDQRLMAIILVGDGVVNVANPETELAQAEKLLADTQTPLISVPLGQAAQTDQYADIAIENMQDQFAVWVKNDLAVAATLSARGFANQVIPVQLIVIDSTGKEEVVDTVRQPISKQSETVNIELNYTPTEPGQYRLIVRAEPQEGEVSPRNNELPGFLTVNEGGLKVLYVYGSLNWEVSYLIRSLGAYKDIQLDQLHLDRRDQARWPLNKTNLFSDPSYDVFILHNVDSRALYRKDGPANLKLLANAVQKGKGMIMIGGYQSFGPGLYHTTDLADVLPIEMEFTERQDFNVPIREELHIQRELKAKPGIGHYVTKLGDPAENDAIWSKLPPLVGANRFEGIKPMAGVVLESTDGEALLVATNAPGRVLAMAADTTYLWWTHGFRDIHKRFWRQVVLWLAYKDNASGDNVRIDLAQRRFQPNTPIRFTASAMTQANEQVLDAQFSGSLVSPNGEKSSVTVINGGASQIDRRLLEQPGIYTLEVGAARNGADIGQAAAEFVIFDNDKEQANPAANPDQLKRMSERTKDYGGEMIAPEELGRVFDELIKGSPKMQIEVPVKWQLGDTWPDASFFVLLFAGLLTWEWWLRKKWGMV